MADDPETPAENQRFIQEVAQTVDERLNEMGFDVRVIVLGRGVVVDTGLVMSFVNVSRISARAMDVTPGLVSKLRALADAMERQRAADPTPLGEVTEMPEFEWKGRVH